MRLQAASHVTSAMVSRQIEISPPWKCPDDPANWAYIDPNATVSQTGFSRCNDYVVASVYCLNGILAAIHDSRGMDPRFWK
jgi:hypothetical protein